MNRYPKNPPAPRQPESNSDSMFHFEPREELATMSPEEAVAAMSARLRLSEMFDAKLNRVVELAMEGKRPWEDERSALQAMFVRLQGYCSDERVSAILSEFGAEAR